MKLLARDRVTVKRTFDDEARGFRASRGGKTRRFASNPAIFRKLFAKKARFIARFQTWKRAYSGSAIFDVSSVLYPRGTSRKRTEWRRGADRGDESVREIESKSCGGKRLCLSFSFSRAAAAAAVAAVARNKTLKKDRGENEGTERILINAGLRERKKKVLSRLVATKKEKKEKTPRLPATFQMLIFE